MHFCALRWPSWLGRQTHRVMLHFGRRHLRHLEIVGSDPTRSISYDFRGFQGYIIAMVSRILRYISSGMGLMGITVQA